MVKRRKRWQASLSKELSELGQKEDDLWNLYGSSSQSTASSILSTCTCNGGIIKPNKEKEIPLDSDSTWLAKEVPYSSSEEEEEEEDPREEEFDDELVKLPPSRVAHHGSCKVRN
jgi:hypothetical protein